MRPIVALAITAAVACSRPPTAAQQGAIVEGTCTVLDAFAGSPLEQAICADAADIIAIEADVRGARADAGPAASMKVTKCRVVGTVCATDAELAVAIQHRKATR